MPTTSRTTITSRLTRTWSFSLGSLGSLGALVLAASVLSAPATASAAPPADAVGPRTAATGKPTFGSCHTLSAPETGLKSDPDPAVPCSRTHTSRTFLVPTVPRGTSMGNDRALARFVARRCTPQWVRTTSRSDLSRAMSSYSYVYFKPTPAQIAAGARWLRCDLILLADRSLAPLPPARVPALGRAPHPDAVARCYIGQRLPSLRYTVCARRHSYRALFAFRVSGPYPDGREREAIGLRRCAPAASRYLLEFPTRAEYRNGDRVFLCARKTSR